VSQTEQVSRNRTNREKQPLQRVMVDVLRKIERIKIRVAKISSEWPSQLTVRGSSYYLRVPKDFIDYYELASGDWLKVRVTEVKRLITQED
jgi:glutamate formiminotransferase